MRPILPALLALISTATPALAQVTTNDAALSALTPSAPAGAPAQPNQPRATTPAHKTSRHVTHPVLHTHPARPTPLPAVPLAPPANPVIVPPPQLLPVHPRPTPPPVPIKPDAPGAATPITGGSRLTFGAGAADLNPAMDQALLVIAEQVRTNPALEITVTAWAPGTNEDPSTPRRLSLDRALAVRAILIDAGIPSERIHAVAKGFTGIEGGPPDRVDLFIALPRTAPPGTPTLPAAKAATAIPPPHAP